VGDVIEEHRGSGLVVAAFSRERLLAVSSFYGWRRRLESPQAGAGFVKLKGVAGSGGARGAGGVAPVAVAGGVHSAGVRIELAGGRHPVTGAINYVLNQWKPLTEFLSDGAIAIHNNIAEQEIKRIALNRKNSLFVGNARGGETAAILSSFTSTCRRLGLSPQVYFTQLLTNLPTTPMSRLDKWLPDQWQPPTRGM